jgi:Secretion system C-terminal sorting domain
LQGITDKPTSLTIMNTNGAIIFAKEIPKTETNTQVDISAWATGYYMMRFVQGNAQSFVKLFKN